MSLIFAADGNIRTGDFNMFNRYFDIPLFNLKKKFRVRDLKSAMNYASPHISCFLISKFAVKTDCLEIKLQIVDLCGFFFVLYKYMYKHTFLKKEKDKFIWNLISAYLRYKNVRTCFAEEDLSIQLQEQDSR